MARQTITNPSGKLRGSISDHRTLKDDAGERLLPYDTIVCEANTAITKGSIVCLLTPADAVTPARVTPKATARHYSSVVGVAEKAAAAAGDFIPVCIYGLTFVDVGSGTPAGGNTALVQANSNQAGVSASEVDATAIVGTVLGHFLGAKDSSNLAPVWVNAR